MPRGIPPVGVSGVGDHFEECLDTVHTIYEKAYGCPAGRRDDPLLVDFADRLVSHRWDEWLVARRLWDRAQRVEGTTASVQRFQDVFYPRSSEADGRRYMARHEALRSAVETLRCRLEGADLEMVVKGVPPGSGESGAGTAGKGIGHLLHEDDTGQLWEVPLPGRSPLLAGERGIRMVRVVDVRPRPDGSLPVCWLFVPPGAETARQAVAWTFGVNPAHYRPTVEA